VADDERAKRKKGMKVIKGEGGSALNKIICFNCQKNIRWYPCPRCQKRPT
jgi:hypothetical protein